MPIYSSIDRLNAMHELFTAQGNGKLDAGEVDALAGFYSGLPASSRAKIETRLVDILDHSKMAPAQRAHLRQLLSEVGLQTDPKLEALLASNDTKSIFLKDIPATARAKIRSEVSKWVAARIDELEAADGYDPDMDSVSAESYEAVKSGGKVIGYRVHIPVYQADHDAGSQLTFDLKGKLVDETYEGE